MAVSFQGLINNAGEPATFAESCLCTNEVINGSDYSTRDTGFEPMLAEEELVIHPGLPANPQECIMYLHIPKQAQHHPPEVSTTYLASISTRTYNSRMIPPAIHIRICKS